MKKDNAVLLDLRNDAGRLTVCHLIIFFNGVIALILWDIHYLYSSNYFRLRNSFYGMFL